MTDRLAAQHKLWLVCEKYIADCRVYYPESVINDKVYEEAPNLMAEIAEIVGYAPRPNDDE